MKNSEQMIISILVKNQPGALIRAMNVFSRRGINISSLNVTQTDEDPGISRIMLVAESGVDGMDQIKKMLEKIYDVKEVEMIEPGSTMVKKQLLVKDSRKGRLSDSVHPGRLADLNNGSLMVEITGESKNLNAFIDFMKPYGMIYTADKSYN